MPMPETAIDEDDGIVLRQHDVGTAWEPAVVQSKPEAQPVEA